MSASSDLMEKLGSVASDVKGAVDSAGTVSKIPLRGVLWDVDLADDQGFTLTPLGRGILAAAAAYGAFKMMGGR